MAGGIIVRDDWPLFMRPEGTRSLRKMAWEPDEGLLERFVDEYYKVDDTDNPFELAYGTVGLGRAVRKPETTPKMFDEPSMGRPFMLVFPTYALAVAISREAQEDDKSNELVPMITRELRQAMVETQEEDAVNQFNDGFDLQGWESDGVPLFSQYHPTLRNQGPGLTTEYWSNRHPTDAALSITALDTAFTELRTQKNDTGRWLSALTPVTLVVPPALYPYALQLTGTARTLGTNNNDINLYYNQLKVSMNPRLTDPNAWFLDAGKKVHSWVWYNRRRPDFRTHVDDISDVTILMTSARWGRGAVHARGKYGSRGPS